MRNGLPKKLIFSVLLTWAAVFSALCHNGVSYAQHTKEVEGLRFQVPEDWPVEKRGGVLGPIPTEEYVSIKFKEVNKDVQALKDELSDKFNGIRFDIEKMGTDLAEGLKKAQDQSASQGGSGQDMTEILARLDEVESQLNRLDRKLTNKLLEIKKEIETISIQAKAAEGK